MVIHCKYVYLHSRPKEATICLISTKIHDLWVAPTPEMGDSPTTFRTDVTNVFGSKKEMNTLRMLRLKRILVIITN